MAEAVFRAMVKEAGLPVRVDSAGTHARREGEPPDARAQRRAARRGYDLSGIRSRMVNAADFASYDLIVAMDEGNLRVLERRCPASHRGKLRLFLEFAPELGCRELPDPYFEGEETFEQVLDMVEAAARRLLDHARDYLARVST